MSFVSKLLPTYKSIKVNTFGGEKLKIKIARDLSSSIGKEIVGTLHINGTIVYIPNNATITIGSSAENDIRIKDKSIGASQFMISSAEGEIAIEQLFPGKTTAVGDIVTGEIRTLSKFNEKAVLSGDSKIALSLSGTRGQLIMDLRVRKPSDDVLIDSLIQELRPRPAIKQLTPGEALAKVEEESALSEPIAIDPKLVEGTVFAEVKTITSLLNTYKNALNYVDRKAYHRDLIIPLSMLPIGGVIGALFIPSSWFFGIVFVGDYFAVFPGAFVGAAAGSFASVAISEITKSFMQKKINNQFCRILKGLSSEEIYNLLILEEDTKIGEGILSLLEKSDLPKALTVRELLASEERENMETQSSLPAVESKPALLPAEESLSDALANADLKVKQPVPVEKLKINS